MRNHSILGLLAAAVLSAELLRRLLHAKRLPLPPGPPPRLLTGNVHQLPKSEPWLRYAEWAKEYGPIVTLRLFHKTHMILNSGKAAMALLDARSGIYSDRPESWMLGHLAGRKRTMFGLSSADARFPKYRRMLHAGLGRQATGAYQPTMERQLKVLMRGLGEKPEAFAVLIKTYVVSIALKISYGYDVSAENDYFVDLIEEGGRVADSLIQPFYFVEVFPLLRFTPSWFPLAFFKRALAKSQPVLDALDAVPFDWAKTQIESGRYAESFFSRYFSPEDGHVPDAEERDILKWTASSIYSGGAHTTTAAITSFFLLMSLHPAVQARAQAEVEAVVGRGRLAAAEDQKALPYVTAVLKEVLRWAPIAPLGLRHRVTKDDVYDGYLIPEGTTVIANIWAITHDTELYPDPSVFDPARHLGDNPQPNPLNFVFGFGRRVCPGAALAEQSLFLAMANILAAFNISRARDAEGSEIEPSVKWRTGTVTCATNFGCRIVPRFPDMLESLAV
ncbi:cytochrome P450 [Mycena rosella]|uniref:Cytochrome P450 n=1 Tax=Mycena rosella TaxID=1033263 RepID=A0AAD7GML6_MYCRO|nr:cytochrome P450 [Mycena rosella]